MSEVNVSIDCKAPADVAKALTKTVGVKKTNSATGKLIILGLLAGAYIGFGSAIATLVSSDLAAHLGIGLTKVITGSVFSIGLILVVIAGAELFTGNNLMFMSVLDKQVNFKKMLNKWIIVYLANFVGSILLALMFKYTDLWKGANFLTGIQALKIANAKVNISFSAALFRGIGCNWLVCLAVWMAVASRNVVGKIFAIYFPIMTFVALGLEHCIANMYFIPLGLFLKKEAIPVAFDLSNLTWGNFFMKNLLPVTIGNIIGGTIFVGFVYWHLYVKNTESK